MNSNGVGGAVSAIGSNLSIADTKFENCSARGGGGAVASSAFPDCFGTNERRTVFLRIQSSAFLQCNAEGTGGALLADSSASSASGGNLEVSILSSHFSQCTSAAQGGALCISGTQVSANLDDVLFDSCQSIASGGAISSSYSSVQIQGSHFYGNRALGLGGI